MDAAAPTRVVTATGSNFRRWEPFGRSRRAGRRTAIPKETKRNAGPHRSVSHRRVTRVKSIFVSSYVLQSAFEHFSGKLNKCRRICVLRSRYERQQLSSHVGRFEIERSVRVEYSLPNKFRTPSVQRVRLLLTRPV